MPYHTFDDTETGRIVIRCSYCETELELPTDLYFLANMKAKSMGWKFNEFADFHSFESIDADDWCCPDCEAQF